jgi:hypothetical protein
MKEKLLMALIGFVVILILSWAVVVVASSYNITTPAKTHVQTPGNQLNKNTDRSDVKSTRPMNVPQGLEKAVTNR